MRSGDFLAQLFTYDRATFDHCVRVSFYLRRLANWLELDVATANQLVLAGLLHDVGKLVVSREIITSESPLDEFGLGEIKKHPRESLSIARRLAKSELVQQLVVAHHEPGYPRTAVRAESRFRDLVGLLQLSDIFDALSSVRSYKPAYSREECKVRLVGLGFDQELVEFLLNNQRVS